MTKHDRDDEQFYRDTESIAFPKLDDQQLAMLEPLGAHRIVRRGELAYKGVRGGGVASIQYKGQKKLVFSPTSRRLEAFSTMGAEFFMCEIESDDIQPMERFAKVGLSTLQLEMVVVTHQGLTVQPYPEPFG